MESVRPEVGVASVYYGCRSFAQTLPLTRQTRKAQLFLNGCGSDTFSAGSALLISEEELAHFWSSSVTGKLGVPFVGFSVSLIK